MADLSDVETVLVAEIAAALYPEGTDAPSALGPVCRIHRGWPSAPALSADLAGGIVNVTVFPDNDPGRTTTRFNTTWYAQAPKPGLTALVEGDTVTFAGQVQAGQLIGVLAGSRSFVHVPGNDETPARIAAEFAQKIRAARPALSAGPKLTVPYAERLAARVVMTGTAFQEVRRQERDLRVTCWCPTPESRDAAAQLVDLRLAQRAFLPLPDGSEARLRYRGTSVYDQAQNALLYRRDLLFTAEYPTIVVDTVPAMLFGDLHLGPTRSLA